MNIFIHEMKTYSKSNFIWTFSLALITIIFFSMYPAFSESAEGLIKLLEGFPPQVLKAFGFTSATFLSFFGFYSFILTYFILCGAIQAMNLGTGIVSKETTRKTADFILTKPVSRKKILSAKLLAVLANLIITNVVFLAVANIMATMVKSGYDFKLFMMLSLTVLFVQVIFASLGFIFSVIAPKIKSVISISLATVFGFFIISMVGAALEDERIRYITPFDYFKPLYIIQNVSYETTFVIIGALFVVTSIIGSYIIYMKKDIHAV